MSQRAQFASTPRCEMAALTGANTARDGSGANIISIFSAVLAGSKIEEVLVKATDNPADSVVTLFIHNGTANFLFDEIDMADPAAASTVLPAFRESRQYSNLWLPTGYSLRASLTVAPTAGAVNVLVFGADFT